MQRVGKVLPGPAFMTQIEKWTSAGSDSKMFQKEPPGWSLHLIKNLAVATDEGLNKNPLPLKTIKHQVDILILLSFCFHPPLSFFLSFFQSLLLPPFHYSAVPSFRGQGNSIPTWRNQFEGEWCCPEPWTCSKGAGVKRCCAPAAEYSQQFSFIFLYFDQSSACFHTCTEHANFSQSWILGLKGKYL